MSNEKKKLLKLAGIIVGVVVLIVVVLLIYHAVANRKLTYDSLQNKVLTAAKKYYKDNKTLLPEKGKRVSVNDITLSNGGYIKSMSEYSKDLDNAQCTAEVVVTNRNDNYRYTALLDCGEKYSTKTIASYIKSKGTVSEGIGLYESNGELIYRGETPNNYLRISGNMFRIVKITDGRLLLIYNEKLKSVAWDNRYNIERKYSDGINDYEVSRIREVLKTFELVKDKDKELLDTQTLYIGKRSLNDYYNDGSLEKAVTVDNELLGLLPLYDYLNASIDDNCSTAATRSCGNYNYLNKYNYNWWTITGDYDNTFKVYRIADTGNIELLKANSFGYVRPTVMLVPDAVYVSGDGSLDNPYIVK